MATSTKKTLIDTLLLIGDGRFHDCLHQEYAYFQEKKSLASSFPLILHFCSTCVFNPAGTKGTWEKAKMKYKI